MKSKRLDLLIFLEQPLMTKGKLILESLKDIDLRRRNARTKKVCCKKKRRKWNGEVLALRHLKY
jgi:hypothetical protein